MSNHVWAFNYADMNDDPPHNSEDKHLVAKDLAEATERAKQFLVDDGLRDDYTIKQGMDFQVVGVRRLMKLDWPNYDEADG